MSVDMAEVIRLARKGKRAEERTTAVKGCLGSLVTSVLATFLKGWLFMLAIGIAHAHWWHSIPTIGFWWSVLFMAVLPSFGSASTAKDKS
ncbi:MAG TPA: hypothetical protein VHK64_08185 [Nocardioidaceae bacterium]|jgi:hypothetical protein|nr:hypothetical protein [Nocardioidaceae bacterium]